VKCDRGFGKGLAGVVVSLGEPSTGTKGETLRGVLACRGSHIRKTSPLEQKTISKENKERVL